MSNINLYVKTLEDIIEKIGIEKLEKFRRIVVFSKYDLGITFGNCEDKVTYISIDKMGDILQSYIDLTTITKKTDLPYLFIFNVTIFDKDFLQKSNWVQFIPHFM